MQRLDLKVRGIELGRIEWIDERRNVAERFRV